MDGFTMFIIGAEALFLIITIAIIIYLIPRRIKKKREENFDKRDN
jgi:hypothetical protein